MEHDRSGEAGATLIARFAYRHEGELARGYLENAGILALLFVDDASGIEAGMAFANPARLMVREEDAERAREVLRDAGVLED
ncbi:MAG: DUF2007 domain-containing protein [Gemmatimonadetes bacterium]|nr:DUF2007 domain-containing protein [Gemmatimonadota bacterium]